MDRLRYKDIKAFLLFFGINPYDFMIISGKKVMGYFPDLEEREPIISVDRLAHVLWEESDEELDDGRYK